MLTNNARAILKYSMISGFSGIYSSQKVVDTSGEEVPLKVTNDDNCMIRYNSYLYLAYNTNRGWRVGSGGRAPTESDYALQNLITEGISLSNAQASYIANADSHELILSLPLKNTSSSNKTIAELGFFVRVADSSSALVDRIVLATPVTILPSEIATINVHVSVPTN